MLVDIQNDFLPEGALAVPDGDAIIPVVNRLQAVFPLVVATQDWQPANHGSFAANHPGKKPCDQVDLNGLPQTLWPVHWVQGAPGAELAPGLQRTGRGGGVDHEDITVHEVPLAEMVAWLEARARTGVLIDPKIYAGLFFSLQHK